MRSHMKIRADLVGVGVLDQLLWARLIDPDEAEDLLQTAERHSSRSVRKRTAFIRGFLVDRAMVGD
jgi:hypothetical protein